jgi:hypothetical protein
MRFMLLPSVLCLKWLPLSREKTDAGMLRTAWFRATTQSAMAAAFPLGSIKRLLARAPVAASLQTRPEPVKCSQEQGGRGSERREIPHLFVKRGGAVRQAERVATVRCLFGDDGALLL